MEYIEDAIEDYINYENEVAVYLKTKKVHGEPIDIDASKYDNIYIKEIPELMDLTYLYINNLLGEKMRIDFETRLDNLNTRLEKEKLLKLLMSLRDLNSERKEIKIKKNNIFDKFFSFFNPR